MNAKPRILLVGERHAALREILHRHASLAEAEDIPEMLHWLESDRFDAILCDWQFSAGTWKEALRAIRSRHCDTPAIVISRTQRVEEGIQEWTEVLHAGAFDLLLAPSIEYSVLSVMEHAVASAQARALRAAGR